MYGCPQCIIRGFEHLQLGWKKYQPSTPNSNLSLKVWESSRSVSVSPDWYHGVLRFPTFIYCSWLSVCTLISLIASPPLFNSSCLLSYFISSSCVAANSDRTGWNSCYFSIFSVTCFYHSSMEWYFISLRPLSYNYQWLHPFVTMVLISQTKYS